MLEKWRQFLQALMAPCRPEPIMTMFTDAYAQPDVSLHLASCEMRFRVDVNLHIHCDESVVYFKSEIIWLDDGST